MTIRIPRLAATFTVSVLLLVGTPQGSDPSFVERFRVSDDGSRLLYDLTATDNEVFSEPVTVMRDWVWRPGEEVKPYECDETE